MPEYLAVKQLSHSDLTFFDFHFQRPHTGGNQKAINLNTDVFIDELFPGLPGHIAATTRDRLSISLHVFGPGFGAEWVMSKNIVKGRRYKNWRLNGQCLRSPEDDRTRFSRLRTDDFAVFNFIGGVVPTAVRMCLVSADNPDEASIHAQLARHLATARPDRSMASLTHAQLNGWLADPGLPEAHPLRLLAFSEDLEDVVMGMVVRPPRIGTRRITAMELSNARKQQEQIGEWGEELANHVLAVRPGISAVRWESRDNAASPYDFAYTEGGVETILDVKATSGGPDRFFHVSWAELEKMAASDHYHLWRFHAIEQGRGILRISTGMPGLARTILSELRERVPGVRVPGVTIHPADAGLVWSSAVQVELPTIDTDDGDEDEDGGVAEGSPAGI